MKIDTIELLPPSVGAIYAGRRARNLSDPFDVALSDAEGLVAKGWAKKTKPKPKVKAKKTEDETL